jgi:NHL repeat
MHALTNTRESLYLEAMGGRFRGALAGLTLTLVLGAAAALVAPSLAQADSTLCPKGSEAGQCKAFGVATDFETGRVYVADTENNRIDVFKDNGEFEFAFGWKVNKTAPAEAAQTCTSLTGCQKGSKGNGDGQFSGPERVAVDNDVASPSHHDVYVFDSGNRRIEKFAPNGELLAKREGVGTGPGQFNDPLAQLAIGPGGNVFVGDTLGTESSGYEPRVEKFSPALAFVEECELPHEDRLVNGLAIDSGGTIYALFRTGGLFKFEPMPGCAEVHGAFPLAPTLDMRAVATDGAGDLWVTQGVDGAKFPRSFRVVTRYSSTGSILRRYGFGSLVSGNADPGIAPTGTPLGAEMVVGEQQDAVKRLVEPPAGPVVSRLVHSEPVGNVLTTLEAEIDPEGKASGYRFEYVTQKSFEEEGGWSSPNKVVTPEVALAGGAADFELYMAQATIGCPNPVAELGVPGSKCLLPSTAYRFRARAKNADGEGNGASVEAAFETAPPLRLEDAFASGVRTDAAKLTLRANPLGIPGAVGWFEYVTRAQFEAAGWAEATQVPDVEGGAGALSFGTGSEPVSRSSVIELTPGTTYHLRGRVTDEAIEKGLVPGFTEPLTSEEAVFRTFAAEASERCAANEVFRSGFAAQLPDCRAYELVSPLDKEGGDVIPQLELSPELPAVLNQSSTSGEKLAYGSYRAFGDAKAAPRTSQYIASRTAAGWVSHFILGQRGRLTEGVTGAFPSELRALSPDLCEAWIKTFAEPPLAPNAVAGQMNLYRRSDQAGDCGGQEKWEAITTAFPPHGKASSRMLDLEGMSADGTKTIYMTRDNLEVEGVQPPNLGGEGTALYYREGEEGEERTHFVCVLPNGAATNGGCGAGTMVQTNASGRESNLTGAISADGQRVFWSTEPASVSGGPGKIYLRENPGATQSAVGCESGKACTIAVSQKGEELSGSTPSQFWAAPPDGSKALYTTGGTLYLYDVEANTTAAIAGKVSGVAAQSTDLSRIYFVSEEALASEPNSEGDSPVAGKRNLYLDEGGSLRFVAGLGLLGQPEFLLGPLRTSRATPDGAHLAFMSSEAPTGYDNTDTSSPARCLPEAEAGSRCDSEVFLYDATANGGDGKLMCASCNPSGGRPSGEFFQAARPLTKYWADGRLPVWESSLYAGGALSEDGSRLYFETAEVLAPRDSNGGTDVYQWEAPGTGSCDEASPSYSSQDDGCVSLISTGQGAGSVSLLDASPSGDDVFFTTAQSLLRQDYGLVDVYDARVGGGLPEPPLPAEPCEGEACQHPAPAPEAVSPTSLNYHGPENLKEGKAKKQHKCSKGKVRKHGKCVKKKSKQTATQRGRAER